jgi:uncharacterized repeat protein (TIGR01451 family)
VFTSPPGGLDLTPSIAPALASTARGLLARSRRLFAAVAFTLTAMLATAAFGAATASAATCDYADTGRSASTLCWLDMSEFNDTTARTAGGQDMTVTVPGGYTMTFNVISRSVGGNPTRTLNAVPFQSPPAGNTEYFGVNGSPRFYTDAGTPNAYNTLTLRNITVRDSGGALVTGYALVGYDAEYTGTSTGMESIEWSSDVPITRATTETYPGGCPPPTGLGTTTVTCTGNGENGETLLLKAIGATTFSQTMFSTSGGEQEAVAFALQTAKLQVTKNVVGRVKSSDSFDVAATSPEGTSIGSATTGSANTATTGEITVLPRAAGTGDYRLSEAITAGSGTVESDYARTLACTNNGATDASLPSGDAATATVSPQAGDDIECVFTNTQRAADVTIKKTASSAVIRPGRDITYTLVATNNGPSTATNVVVGDDLPTGLSFVSASAGCAAAGTAVTCNAGTLAVGESRTFTVTAHIATTVNGAITNTGTVKSDTPDDTPGNNTDEHKVPLAQADLSIVKSADPTTVVPGTNQTYKLVVKNNGPDTAENVRVADALPAGLTYVSASPECSLAGATVACTVASLASGDTRTFTVTAKVASSVNGRLTNTATVNSDTPDPDPGNNTSTVVVPTKGQADLSITKTPSVRTVGPNGQVLYTLVVKNNGPSDATDVTVTDTPPTGLTLQAAKGGAGTTCGIQNNQVSCQLGTLAAGGTAQVLVTAQATATASGELTNRATVTGNEHDPDPGNNTTTTTVTVPPPPGTPLVQPTADLTIVKTVNARRIRLGQSLTYTVVVTNKGPAAATNAVVTDTLAVPARNVSIKPSVGKCTGTVPFTCQLGTLQPGQKVTITVKLTPTKAGTARNTASVTSPGTDPKTDDNISGVSTTVSKPTLGLTKGANRKTVKAGQTITYTLRVKNPSAATVKNVKVCDDLPSGLVYVSSKSRAKLTKGQYCWTVKSLGAGKSKTFTLTARALKGTSGTKTNRASASSPDARSARASRSVRVTRTALRAGGVTG